MSTSEDRDAAEAPRPEPGFGVAPPGFRMPHGLRLGRVCLQVADLERSLGFYARVIGMRTLSRSADRVVLGPQQADTPLVELRERRGALPPPPGGQLGLYHFAILLPGRAALGRFAQHLAQLGTRPGASDHLVSEALYLHDPDGLGIEVYADRPRSLWRRQHDELVMDTRPLDLADLIRAAAGQEWAGLPAGSAIGHIHLHVGDLGRATEFYHRALGLDRVAWSYPGALFLSAGGYHHHVGVNTWAASRVGSDAHARLLEWELTLPGHAALAAAAQSLEACGFAPDRVRPDELRVADPWGTVLRLTAGAEPA